MQCRIMTNKEKADEISGHYSTSRYFPTDEETAAYDAAMQMAEWKDKNFDAFLDYLIVLGNKDIIDAICDYRGEKLEE